MAAPCKRQTRSLFAWEIQEARRVFGDQLRYEKIRIHECARWTNAINLLGQRLKHMPVVDVDNAITLGRHCFFPVRMLEMPVPADDPEYFKLPWLIHELTHTWQYQRMGWIYLAKALRAQTSLGAQAYIYGGEQGLVEGQQSGRKLADFNLEQQGDIARDYYWRMSKGLDTSAWTPYIAELQKHIG
jgi:hypothetical protein